MKNKYKTQRKWLIVIMLGLSGAVQAGTIVNWGTPTGDSTMVTGGARKATTAGATYALISPLDGAGGYDLNAAGQTRTFYGASSEAFNNTLINDGRSKADYIQLVKNYSGALGTFTTMIAWESQDFLTLDKELETMTVRYTSRGGTAGTTAYFLIETTAGWYKSTENNLQTSTSVPVDWTRGVAGLTWVAFSEFGVTPGAVAADISDIQSAGVYFSAVNSLGNNWAGTKVEYVNVTAIPGLPPIATVELGAVITLP